MLKSLEISGFKSFARKEELEFKTPISAIVGPNGSGKSNVAEAFRFVLGEQSLKSMRGKRCEDLIFSGSKNERSSNRAGVKVVFDNSRRFLNIDYDEVTIERVVHRDSVNQYFINKSQVRLKDILELLAGANIGASGHHIISQGEADRILIVNPKERRGMIEEALGLRIYQYKILESEKKLKKVEENIKSVASLRREIKPHLNFLLKQVKKIEKSLELKEELKSLYKEYFKREDEYLRYQKEYISKNKKPLTERISELGELLLGAEEVLNKENKNEENKEISNLENKLNDIRSRKSDLERKIGQLEGMITFEERRLEREKQRQDQNEENEENRVIKFKEVKKFADSLKGQLNEDSGSSLSDFIKKIKEIIDNFISQNLQSEETSPARDLDDKELNKLKEEKKGLDEEMKNFLSEEKIVVADFEKVKSEIESEKDTSRKAEVRIFEIKAQKSEINSKLNSLKNLEDKIDIEDENYKRELKEAFVLAGRDSIQFFDFEISLEEVINEDRNKQEERRRIIERIKIKLEDMGGGSSEEIMKEYKEVQERDEFLEKEILDLDKSATSLNELIAELKEKLDLEFKEGIEKINVQFNSFFATMFGGGRAELFSVKAQKRKKAEDIDDFAVATSAEEYNEEEEQQEQDGIDINVALPNKKTKGLQMLSGGERSLTSIALIFAMSQINPPPFIILDETDAALDEANSRRYGDMIENLSKYSQLILITHNRETMARAGLLYGITMGGDGVSRLLSVELDEAVKVAK